MTISAENLALAMFKERFKNYPSRTRGTFLGYEDLNNGRKRQLGGFGMWGSSDREQEGTWSAVYDNLSKYVKNYAIFLMSSRVLSATQEQAHILDIEPKQLYEELKLAKFVIESGLRQGEDFSGLLPENWVEQLYVAIDNFYEEELENAEKPLLTDEVNSLAVFFNQKTDEFLIAMRDLRREYDSLAGDFRRSTSTYNYDSGKWMGAFLDGLSKFLDIAQKQEFNIEKLSSEHDTTLGSERYRIKIEGLNPEGRPHATFAQAFDGDVKHFSNTGTYGHAVCNGKVALYVTLYNLGNDESLLYKNGQSQYWYLGSLITI